MPDASNPHAAATFAVRLVETYYHNRLEWEDGPGSLQNIVSDTSHRSYAMGDMTLAEAEGYTKSDLEDEGFFLDDDSDDGFEEYSYKLEYLDPATGTWRYVKSFL